LFLHYDLWLSPLDVPFVARSFMGRHILWYVLVLVYHCGSYQGEGSSEEQAMETSPLLLSLFSLRFC
jgi:hypothetical protein